MRLNLFIAKAGLTSRRKADCFIKEGKVEVNGKLVFEPYFGVDAGDEVRVSGKLLKPKECVYLLFNKPKGVTTTLKDKHAGKTIADFIPSKHKGIYPAGRLDRDSCGLLILTNDGDFCYRLTHPKFLVEKEYLMELEGFLKDEVLAAAKRGVRDKGEWLKVKTIEILKRGQAVTVCKVVITEGKKRHLRRLFKQLGYPVKELKRVRIGKFILGNLKSGQYRLC